MPSKTARQAKAMRAAAHSPTVAKSMGVPQKVAREFTAADAKAGKPAGKGKTKR